MRGSLFKFTSIILLNEILPKIYFTITKYKRGVETTLLDSKVYEFSHILLRYPMHFFTAPDGEKEEKKGKNERKVILDGC